VTRWRIVFFGTPEFAIPSLQTLLDGPDTVTAVVCQPDKPAGRGQHSTPPPVKRFATANGLPVFQPVKVRSGELLEQLRVWAPDLIVVVAYGRILPRPVLELPPLGSLNVHASLLPKYRGAAPIQWAILNGDTTSGITIMQMTEELDAGDILLQKSTPIGPTETYGELQERLSLLGAEALGETLCRIEKGEIRPTPQDAALASLSPMIRKQDGRIRWTDTATLLANRVRAFNPWPSAFTSLHGKLLKIHRAHAEAAEASTIPGTITGVGTVIRVATGEGDLCLEEIQLEGRRRMMAAEFAHGGHVQVGTVLG